MRPRRRRREACLSGVGIGVRALRGDEARRQALRHGSFKPQAHEIHVQIDAQVLAQVVPKLLCALRPCAAADSSAHAPRSSLPTNPAHANKTTSGKKNGCKKLASQPA